MIWIIFSIIILLLIIFLLIAMFKIRKGKKIPTDYYNLFIIGIVWFIIGIPLENYVLMVLGIIFGIVGLIHKKKWKKNHRTWKDLSKAERKFKMWIIWILLILVIFGIIALLIFENEPDVDLSKQKAIDIALNSDCMNEGNLLTGDVYYNDITKTWWIEMDIEKEGCSPACVVSEDGNAEINWRCTGLVE